MFNIIFYLFLQCLKQSVHQCIHHVFLAVCSVPMFYSHFLPLVYLLQPLSFFGLFGLFNAKLLKLVVEVSKNNMLVPQCAFVHIFVCRPSLTPLSVFDAADHILPPCKIVDLH